MKKVEHWLWLWNQYIYISTTPTKYTNPVERKGRHCCWVVLSVSLPFVIGTIVARCDWNLWLAWFIKVTLPSGRCLFIYFSNSLETWRLVTADNSFGKAKLSPPSVTYNSFLLPLRILSFSSSPKPKRKPSWEDPFKNGLCYDSGSIKMIKNLGLKSSYCIQIVAQHARAL